MTNRRSPCLTIWPSLKWMESMKPETRARTSTVFTATKRPVYSSHSVIASASARETVTAGGCGPALAAGLLSQPARARLQTERRQAAMRVSSIVLPLDRCSGGQAAVRNGKPDRRNRTENHGTCKRIRNIAEQHYLDPARPRTSEKALAKFQAEKKIPAVASATTGISDFGNAELRAADYFSAAAGASVAMSTFTPGPMVEEIETRLM